MRKASIPIHKKKKKNLDLFNHLIDSEDPNGFVVASRTKLAAGGRVVDVVDGRGVSLVNTQYPAVVGHFSYVKGVTAVKGIRFLEKNIFITPQKSH